jgi:hypothetical protein
MTCLFGLPLASWCWRFEASALSQYVLQSKGGAMVKVRTFTNEIKIFRTMKELSQLDEQVNRFIAEKGLKKVISVSDTCTTDSTGATMGIIRALTYDDGE